MVIVAVGFIYFGNRLLKVIENNNVGKENRGATMRRAVRRVPII